MLCEARNADVAFLAERVQAANGRCAWGEDQPAIPILATIVQNKNRFSDKKLQLTLHCQVGDSPEASFSLETALCGGCGFHVTRSVCGIGFGNRCSPQDRAFCSWIKS